MVNIVFLDKENFGATYRSGVWTMQHFHTHETLRELLLQYFEKVEFYGSDSLPQLYAIASHPRKLSRAKVEEAITTEFNMEYPGNYRHNRHAELVTEMMQKLEQERGNAEPEKNDATDTFFPLQGKAINYNRSVMNMRTTLMLLAATMAPAYAQQPADSAATFAALAAAPAATTATPQQRADVYPALEYIPANAEAFITINNIGSIASTINKMIVEEPTDLDEDIPAEVKAIESVAIATSQGSAESLKALAPWLTLNEVEEKELLPKWASVAANPAQSIISRLSQAYRNTLRQAALNNLGNIKLPPVYSVLTTTPGNEQVAAMFYQEITSELQNDCDYDENITKVENIKGFSGAKFKLVGKVIVTPDYDYIVDEETHDITFKPKELSEDQKRISEEIDKRSVYVLFKQQGNAIVAVICENPDEIVVPADVNESILGTDKLAFADANLEKYPDALAWSSGAIEKVYNDAQAAPYLGMAQVVTDSFKELAATDAPNAATWEKAAKGVELLSGIISNATTSGNIPSTIQIWSEASTIDLLCTTATNGASYLPGKLALTALADKPSTICYAERTMISYKAMPSCDAILDATVNVVDGMVATLNPEAQTKAAGYIAIAKSFLPEAKSLLASFATIGSGMGNSMALTIDSAGAMPAILGGTPGNTAAIPRICFYSGVTDRSKLADGWDQLVNTAAKIAVKLGSDPSVVNMLPIVPSQSGNMTAYNISMPWFTPNMVPNVTVSDTTFTVGTSSAYNAEVTTAATGSMPFAGAVFSLKFAPLATTARGIADELSKVAAAEAKPAEAKPADVEDETESDDEWEDDYYTEMTPAQERANSADNIAETCETIARFVERVNGTVTTANDTVTSHIQIQLKR